MSKLGKRRKVSIPDRRYSIGKTPGARRNMTDKKRQYNFLV